MANEIVIKTTYGPAKLTLPYAKKIATCGINMRKELQIRVYTHKNERAGYVCYYNLITHKKRFSRIEIAFISEESRRKYGSRCVHETLPILHI